MAYQKLQQERSFLIKNGDNFNISMDNPFIGIKQTLYGSVNGTTGNNDFTFTQSGGLLTGFTLRTKWNKNQFNVIPTYTLTTVSGGGSSATVDLVYDGDFISFSVNDQGSSYTNSSVLKLSLSGYTLSNSARLQPFVVYTNDGPSIDSVYSSGGDYIGTITCNTQSLIPIQMSSVTSASASGLVALW